MRNALILMTAVCVLQEQEWNESALYGEWQWMYSTGGFTGQTISSRESKTVKRIVLSKDHLIMYFAGDSLITRRNYQVQIERNIFSNTPGPVLRLSGLSKTQIITMIGRDTLKLKDNAFDGYEHGYVRIR